MSAPQMDAVEPACRYASTIGEDNTWIQKPLTERLQAWYDPCGMCYPDGEIDTVEVVRKKRRKSTPQSLHRPKP